jgi:hypothetical protein
VRIGVSVGFVTSRIAFARGYLNSSAQPIDFAHLFVGIPQTWAGMPRVAPGDPEGSGALQRFLLEDAQRMPSIGTSVIDPFGTTLLRDWIAQLQSCP